MGMGVDQPRKDNEIRAILLMLKCNVFLLNPLRDLKRGSDLSDDAFAVDSDGDVGLRLDGAGLLEGEVVGRSSDCYELPDVGKQKAMGGVIHDTQDISESAFLTQLGQLLQTKILGIQATIPLLQKWRQEQSQINLKLQYICKSSMLTQQINPPPSSNEQIYIQPQPQIQLQSQVQPQTIAPPNAFQYTQSVQLRPLPAQIQQSSQSVQNISSGQYAIDSSINRSAFASIRGSKYNNKYSFKRHGAVNRSKLMSNSVNQVQASGMRDSQESLVNEVNYWRSIAQQQENALVRIREFAFNRRRGIVDSSALGLESIRHANSLSEIYNLSLLDGKLQPLEFLAENQQQQQVIQTSQQLIQNGQQILQNGAASTVTRQQQVVVNYELVNQRSNSQIVNNNISVNNISANNNRPVLYIQQANQTVRPVVNVQNVQQFQFQESASFVPAPVPVPVQVPVNISSTTTTVTAQRNNIPAQYVQITQVAQSIREPIKESPRPQSTTINPEASFKPQPQKNDFSIPSYTPYQQSYKPYEVSTYKSNETTYKPYQAPAYTSNQAPVYTSKQQSFYFTRETQQYTLPNQNALNINTNSNSQLYTLQIRELRNKVQTLEQQKSTLIDKIRLIQKTNFSSNNSQETIQVYRDEINQLKIQIAELTELYNSGSGRQHNDTEVTELRKSILILSETNKQYEEQLIQAQNHIIYLQNSRNADENTLHLQEEVKYLRETIAKYTEHVQQLDLERQKYHELLQQRESEIQNYLQEVNESRAYIETLEGHIQKTKNAVQGNGVSYDTYNQLIAEYGRKQLQVIILMEEINRLNYRYNELQAHLEKAEEYIIHIQEANSGAAVNGNELGLLREQYEAELARTAEEKNTLNLTIQRLQNSIEQSSIIERTTKVSSSVPLNVNDGEESRLRQELARKEEETRLLSEELTILSSRYAETKDHLEKAEDYIIHLQEIPQAGSPVNTLVAPDTDRQRLEEELNLLQAKLGQYQSQLLQERREREIVQNRSQLFSAEYEDMESRYKNALDSLNKRYDQLLQERNSITVRLSEAEDRLLTEASTANREDISHLNTSMQSLDLQLKETREHLQRAEEYIEGNMRVWQEASGYKERHDQQLAFIQLLHQDLDNSKRQNEELAAKLEHFDNLVGEIERLRSDNEKLTIVVHSKDNAGNSTSLKQIDQTQESLENYTRLYQDSQARVSTLRAELQALNQQLLAKQSQLDQTVHRSLDTEDHLRKAEEHIIYMQQELTSSQAIIQELQTALRAETAKSTELIEALKHAEDHIYNIQQQIKAK